MDELLTEEEAGARASELNRELGRGKPTSKFHVPVEVAAGQWTVELGTEPKRSWRERVVDLLLEILHP
jgi:hypothetical protein